LDRFKDGYGSVRVRVVHIRFNSGRVKIDRSETDWVIAGVDHFGSYQILGSDRLWVGLLQIFGSKSVVFILDVGSGMNSGCSVQVSGLGSVLPDLVASISLHYFILVFFFLFSLKIEIFLT